MTNKKKINYRDRMNEEFDSAKMLQKASLKQVREWATTYDLVMIRQSRENLMALLDADIVKPGLIGRINKAKSGIKRNFKNANVLLKMYDEVISHAKKLGHKT